jgi:hypothetical protein
MFPFSPHPQINPSLPDADADCGKASNVIGKGGAAYKKHGAFCLETQKYADAVHHVSELTRRKSLCELSFCVLLLGQLPINHPEPGRSVSTRNRLQVRHRFRLTAKRTGAGIKLDSIVMMMSNRNKSTCLITINAFALLGKRAF